MSNLFNSKLQHFAGNRRWLFSNEPFYLHLSSSIFGKKFILFFSSFRKKASRKIHSRTRHSVARAVALVHVTRFCRALLFRRAKGSLAQHTLGPRVRNCNSGRRNWASSAAAGPICYLSGILSPRSGRNCPSLFRFRVGDVRVHYGGRCNRFAYALAASPGIGSPGGLHAATRFPPFSTALWPPRCLPCPPPAFPTLSRQRSPQPTHFPVRAL